MAQTNGTKAPQDKVCGYEYTVKRGDSFYLIAHRLGVPLRDLLEANSDINPARLMVGDVLCIPMEEDDCPQTAPQTPAPAPETPTETETPEPETPPIPQPPMTSMSPDDTEDLDAPAVQPDASNIIIDTSELCPEADRHIVAEGETAADLQLQADINLHTLQTANPDLDLDTLTAGDTICLPQENQPCPSALTYTLMTDETLESVALKLNVSIASLLRANPCLAPSNFKAGMCILVPEG